MEFKLTDKAIEAVKEQVAKNDKNPYGIRIGLRGGGCDGFSYVFEWLYKGPTDKDHIFTFGDVKIVIDPKSMVYLNGTELDYVSGLMGHGFKFNNPNAKGSCGCGASVHF